MMSVSQEIIILNQAFVDGLERILGEKLYGAYVFGAAAFPEALPTVDIDFHVILKGALTDHERAELELLHKSLAEMYPPLGREMDGYYILLSDAVCESPPRSQMWQRATDDSWALHREHIRAGRHIILFGPDPREIYPPASWSEIENALYGELNYVQKHLQDYPDYCILNLCRLIYSFETRDVVISKDQASEWARAALPEWSRHIELARKSYARQATPGDKQFLLAEVGSFFDFARVRIARACKESFGKVMQVGAVRRTADSHIRNLNMYTNYKTKLRQLLIEKSDPKAKEWWEGYVKESAPFLGVKMGRVRAITHHWYEENVVNNLNFEQQLDLALALFQGDYTEEKLAGTLFLQEILHPIDAVRCERDLGRFAELFIQGYIYDWNVCDWFCVKVLGPIIKKEGEGCAIGISEWKSAENLWQARASLVAFVPVAENADYYGLIENACQVVIRRQERFAKTAVGWILRDISKHDPMFVVKIVTENIAHFSIENLKNATKYFTNEEKHLYVQMLKDT